MKKLLICIIPPLIVQIVFLLTWHILAISGLFPPTFLTAPLAVAVAIGDLAHTGELWEHLGWSLARVGEGFAIGGGIGFVLGGLIGVSQVFDKWVSPTLNALKQVPIFAWGPMMIVAFGIDEMSKIAFIAVACFYPVLLATYQGVKAVQSRHLEVAAVFGLDRLATFRRVVFPIALPSILTGIRQSLALAWMAVVGAELMGAESGIGYLMMQARMLFQMDIILAGVFLIGAVGITINTILEQFEKKFVFWGREI